MTRFQRRASGVLAALLISTAARAEVTADQVWQNWQAVASSYGQSMVAGSEQRSGDTLTLSDVAIVSSFEGGSVKGQIKSVAFRELGDGTVEVTMSPDYPLTVETTSDEGKKALIHISVRQPDLRMIASGTATETDYDFTAPSVKAAVDDVTYDGKPFDVKAEFDLTAMSGRYAVSKADKTTLETTFKADSLGIVAAVVNPESSETVNMTGSLTALAGTSTGVMLDAAAMADMSAALKAGFTTNGNVTYGAGQFDFDMVNGADTAKGDASLGSGNIVFALDADHLNYGGGAKAATFKLSGTTIPLPEVVLSYAEVAFNILMPVTKSDTAGDFALLTRLVDFKISDGVWNLFDPGTVLPRDPATIVVDATGKAKWLFDIFDPEAMEKMDPAATPVAVDSLNINDLTVRAAGAEVTGKGAFTFDNADTTTFDGMPAPTGALDLKIVGANGLLDKLIQLGFLPEDQAMSARMMMGLFAKPGEGEDTLTSTLEFKDKGFYANGQRLQ